MSKQGRSGHSKLFPNYTKQEANDRWLCLIERNKLYEYGGQVREFSSPFELESILWSKNYLAIVDTFTSDWFVSYLDYFVLHILHRVMCNSDGKATSIRLSQGRHTRWIVRAKVWGVPATMHGISIIADACDYVGCGIHTSPGALGYFLLRRTWYDNRLERHTALGRFIEEYIRENATGGRCDTPGLGNFYQKAIEYDMVSAHLANHVLLPSGTAVLYEYELPRDYFTWFGDCTITIPRDLSISPFSIRNANGELVYPRTRGTYRTHIWKEQYNQCVEAGCRVQFHRGYGWREGTADTSYWCRDIYRLRQEAPTADIAHIMKGAIVSTIGRHNMSTSFHVLVPHDKAKKYDLPLLNAKGEPTMYCISDEINRNAVPMTHWYYYTVMRTSAELYAMARPFAEEESLIATNYDSVLTSNVNSTAFSVDTNSKVSYLPGTWRGQILTGVYIPAPRSIVCDQKTREPGRKRVA